VPDKLSHLTVLIFQNLENPNISTVLKSGNIDIHIITSANEAETLRLFELHHEISIALVSADLAGLTGFEVIRSLQNHNPTIPIILLSNYLNLPAIRLANLLGCNEILQTPVSPPTLQGIMKKYLHN
jgi:CheY-like chemotaxis protein